MPVEQFLVSLRFEQRGKLDQFVSRLTIGSELSEEPQVCPEFSLTENADEISAIKDQETSQGGAEVCYSLPLMMRSWYSP